MMLTLLDYGNQEINNFCVSLPCSWSVNYTTLEDTCYGDNDGQILVNVNNGTRKGREMCWANYIQ